jgi:hypothetical protein
MRLSPSMPRVTDSSLISSSRYLFLGGFARATPLGPSRFGHGVCLLRPLLISAYPGQLGDQPQPNSSRADKMKFRRLLWRFMRSISSGEVSPRAGFLVRNHTAVFSASLSKYSATRLMMLAISSNRIRTAFGICRSNRTRSSFTAVIFVSDDVVWYLLLSDWDRVGGRRPSSSHS